MCFKWRILFLIFPEFLFSNSFTVQHLILCLIIRLIATSMHSFPTLTNIEWKIHKLSSLHSMNEKFYPLSLSIFTTLNSLISLIPKDAIQTDTTGQKLWNILIQSLYSPTWNPAELFSPISRKHKHIYSRKCIFIIGSFPSLPAEYNVFFSRDVRYFGLEQLSALFFEQILTSDLTKSLFSNSIRLVWINTNNNLSRRTLSLQKCIKVIIFIHKSEILSIHNLFSFYALSQLDPLPFNSSLEDVSSTYSITGIFGISSLQSRVYKNVSFFRSFNNVVSSKFIRLLNHITSPVHILTLNSIKIILCLNCSKTSLLTFFDFDHVFSVASHFPCNLSIFNQLYLALFTERNGSTAIVLLNFHSQFIGYLTFINMCNFLPLATFHFNLFDSPNSHFSDNISFPFVNLPPFSSQMLFHSFILSFRMYTPDITLFCAHGLLELIESDHVSNQHSLLANLYLLSRPCSSKFLVHLYNLHAFSGIGVFDAVNDELLDCEQESILVSVNHLSLLIHSVQNTSQFALKAKLFVNNLSKKVRLFSLLLLIECAYF